jgi:hypothetical protein
MRGIDTTFPDQVWTRTQLYSEEFTDDEKSILNDIEALCKVIPKNQELFNTELANLVGNERSLIRRMDYIANHVLKDNKKRLNYLQEVSNLDRWILVTTQIAQLNGLITQREAAGVIAIDERDQRDGPHQCRIVQLDCRKRHRLIFRLRDCGRSVV